MRSRVAKNMPREDAAVDAANCELRYPSFSTLGYSLCVYLSPCTRTYLQELLAHSLSLPGERFDLSKINALAEDKDR